MVTGYKKTYKIPLVLLGLVGACAVIYLVSLHGAGTLPDSVYYVSVARHIADGTGFVGYDGYYLVLQPPLYPFVLAAIKTVFFTDPLVSSGYVNAILFGLTIYFTGLFLLKHLTSYIVVLLGTISILISFALIQLSIMVLSESLFIFLVLLFLYYFDEYKTKGNISSLILFAAAASLACLTRYIGVILILTGVINILFQKSKLFKEKLQHIIVFIFITCLPIGLWIIRNIVLSKTFVGQRADSSYTLYDNITFLVNTILQWFLPFEVAGWQLFASSLIIFVLLLLLIIWWRKKNWIYINELYPVFIFIILYSVIILITSTTTAYDHIANRLLSPIHIPAIIIIFFVFDKVLIWLSGYFSQKLVTALFIVIVLSWYTYPVGKTIYIINDYIKSSGFGYNSINWDKKETIKYITDHKELSGKYTFYSNVPEAVYILTNIQTRWSPAKTLYNSPQLININSNLKEIWDVNNKICLVWFYDADRQFLYPLDELQKGIKMKMAAQFKDGAVFTIGD